MKPSKGPFARLLVPLAAIFFLLSGIAISQVATDQTVRALYIQIEGGISPAKEDLLQSALTEARDDGYDLLLIRLDTPGGLGETMRNMVKEILNSPIPVAVWVGPAGARAASAGVFLVAAANYAAMSPQTNIGSASPVSMGGGEMDETMESKVKNDILSLVRAIARVRGRNVDWYLDAVNKADNITAAEAVQRKVVDMLALDPHDFLEQIGKRGIQINGQRVTFGQNQFEIVDYEPGIRYKLLAWLLEPQIAYFLLLGGIAGLFFELTSPGAIIPGVIGGICLLLGLYAMAILPTNAAGLLLIAFGLVLFLLEIKVTSYGLLSIAAIICLFVGSLILFDFKGGLPGLPMSTIIVTVAGVSALIGLGVYLAAKAQLTRPAQGMQALEGEIGVVKVWDKTKGQIFVRGELWSARAPNQLGLSPGQEVKVVAAKSLVLVVEPFRRNSNLADDEPLGSNGRNIS